MIRLSFNRAVVSMLVLLTGILLSASAVAEIPKDQIVGTWKGKMIMVFGEATESIPMTMIFMTDGKATLQTEDAKPDETTYQIDGDKVILKDPEGKGADVKLTTIRIDKTTLKADLEMVGEDALPEGTAIKVDMTRQ